MIDKCLLHRMQVAVWSSETFDGGDFAAAKACREHQTGENSPAVHQHRAGATLAMVAPLFGAREFEMIAQPVQQGGAGVEGELVPPSIDR